MIALFAQRFPLRQIVAALFLDVGLRVCTVCACEFLRDGVLHADRFDGFVEATEGFVPVLCVLVCMVWDGGVGEGSVGKASHVTYQSGGGTTFTMPLFMP